MSNLFNGNTINSTPVPIIPSQQIVIPPVTIPQGFSPRNSYQTYTQLTAKNKEAAKNTKLGPNSKVAIFDEEDEIFYLRETDEYGNDVSFKTYMYTEVEDPPEPEYLTVQEFRKTMDDLMKKMKEESLDV